MKFKNIASLLAVCLMVFGVIVTTKAQSPGYKFSEAYTHKNLTIFLIHGKNATSKNNILTLQEAMAKDIFAVYETSEVNELEVENLSKEFDVFIQSGDIVKGGKQDRVLAVSIIIPARSGRVRIQSFCVESGRWEKRENESAGKFSSSEDRIVTRDLKVAANESRSQGEVWKGVEKAQDKLSANVAATVNSAKSKTSLQLSLENKKVKEAIDEYIKTLARAPEGKSDVIGYAFAINGEINSADIYASNALFKKLWAKMLKASATEAVAEYNKRLAFRPAKAKQVEGFLADADKAKAEERHAAKGAKVIIKADEKSSSFEAVDEATRVTVHKSYVKKGNN